MLAIKEPMPQLLSRGVVKGATKGVTKGVIKGALDISKCVRGYLVVCFTTGHLYRI
jgi:hypothetical protein